MKVRVVSETDTTVTIAWDPVQGQGGYVPTIDGSEILSDGKRHAGTSKTRTTVPIGRVLDGQPHSYGVNILGVISSGAVISPAPQPGALPFTKDALLWETQNPARKADIGAVNMNCDGWWNSGTVSLDDVAAGVQMRITTDPNTSSGIRATRCTEPKARQQYYAEAIYLIPVLPSVGGWVQCQQIKSWRASTNNTEPFWFITMQDKSGVLEAFLTWWGSQPQGAHQGEAAGTRDYPLSKPLPIGKSFTLGMAVKQASDYTGRVVVVLDGEVVQDQDKVITGAADSSSPVGISRAQWCATNYGRGLTPSPFLTVLEHAAMWAVSGL